MELVGTKKVNTAATGMQKFYSKFIHKIEDFPPKFNKNQIKVTKTPIDNIKPLTSDAQHKLEEKLITNSTTKATTKHRTIISINSSEDETDESLIQLSEKNSSLEAEIFEELEKVAHDEAKLNEVLKNFDKIIIDYKTETLKRQTKHVNPQKPLQKSKTCSIIESRCILKKHCPSPTPIGKGKKLTKSLWNIPDLDKFVKSGVKANIGPVLKPVPIKKEPVIRSKSNLPRAKSVWDIGNNHTPCVRTVSGSKIPIKTGSTNPPSRSQSFINNSPGTHTTSSLKKSSQFKSTIGNLNNVSSSTSVNVTKPLIRKNSISTTAINKVGVTRKLSLKPGSSELNLDMKRSQAPLKPTPTKQLSTVKAKSTMNLSCSSQQKLSLNTRSLSTQSKRRDFTNTLQSKDDSLVNNKRNPIKSRMATSTTSLNKKQDYALVIVNKKSSTPVATQPTKIRTTLKSHSQTLKSAMNYATESKLSPKLESCKIIPPVILSSTLNKNTKVSIKDNTTRKFTNIMSLTSDKDHNDKDYQSDCSEDSGHISNGSDENHIKSLLSSTSLQPTTPISATQTPPTIDVCKTGKISEALLEKFEMKPVSKMNKTLATLPPSSTTVATAVITSGKKSSSNNISSCVTSGCVTKKSKVGFFHCISIFLLNFKSFDLIRLS